MPQPLTDENRYAVPAARQRQRHQWWRAVALTGNRPDVVSNDQPFRTAEREQMSTARAAKPAPTDEPLMGMPAPEPAGPPKPSAGELVRVWCASWARTHGGQQPHGSVVRRVAGVCRNVAKDCENLEEWRAAWYAARDAGAAGQYDVVRFLAAPAAVGRGNHYLELVREPGSAATGGLLGAMLAGGEAQSPAALGGAS